KPELAKEIERIIGYQGSMGGGVFHITVPRNDIHVHAMDAAIPGSMGMNTPLNFQLDGKTAAINGDFMLLAAELNQTSRHCGPTPSRWHQCTIICWTTNRG